MSLLGKKRTKRDDEDEKVRYKHIILTHNSLFKKEYEQMFGIKQEEPKDEENNNKQGENNILNKEEKIENKDIKIVEITINLPKKERIKAKTEKKENKQKTIEQKSNITLFPESNKKDSKNIIEIKEESNETEKNNTNNNIFATKPKENPFSTLVEKDNKDKNNDEKKLSLFGNINNNNKDDKKETNPPISLFGNTINNKDDKKETNPPISLFGNTINNKDDKKEINPPISLFGNTNDNKDSKNNSIFGNTNTTSLFSGNNNKSLFSGNNNISLFSGNNNNNTNSLFSGNTTTSLFFGNNDNKPLFSNTNNKTDNNSIPLFSNNNINSNPFSQIKGELFLKTITNNKNDDNKQNNNESLFGDNLNNEDNDEEEDERDKPKTKYVSEPLKAQDYSNYSKLYNTHLNNLFLFNKTEKKFISKGNGFFSIEKTKDENKQHQAVIVFRNQTGNKLVEGFVDKKFDKFDIYSKDFNYVVSFGIIMINEGKPELGYIKIPFKSEENANALKEAFGKALLFLDGK